MLKCIFYLWLICLIHRHWLAALHSNHLFIIRNEKRGFPVFHKVSMGQCFSLPVQTTLSCPQTPACCQQLRFHNSIPISKWTFQTHCLFSDLELLNTARNWIFISSTQGCMDFSTSIHVISAHQLNWTNVNHKILQDLWNVWYLSETRDVQN